MLLSYSTCSYVDCNFYNRTDTGNLLANKLTNIGDIELPGWLDIDTFGYTNPRIRCNAVVGACTGYAELRAASSYGMFVNLSTSRTDGGWVYFKINNDGYIQLSGSGNKVNIYKDTSIQPNLTINGNLDSSKKLPLDINNSTIHTEIWTLASFHQAIENSGSWLQFSRDGTSNTWQSGMSSDSSYVIRASDATNALTVNQTCNTSISGDLDIGCIMNTTKINLTNDDPNNYPLVITGNGGNWFQGEYVATANQVGCLFRHKTSGSSTYWWSGVWGSNTNVFNIWFYYQGKSMVVLF